MGRKEEKEMVRIYYSLFGPFIVKFIALKNSLGYKYKDAGRAFSHLDGLALKNNVSEVAITKELAEEYGQKRPNETEKTRYNRIQLLGQFSRFLCDIGIRSYIPRLPKHHSMFTPYIFSSDEIGSIFRECDSLVPSARHRNSAVFAIPFLIRLLYATGIRIGEALYLSTGDIHPEEGYLTVRDTKNGKDRLIPFSASMRTACEDFLAYRALFPGAGKSNRLLILPDGRLLGQSVAYRWFRKVIWSAGISHGGRGRGPRLHDLRHTFSVHSLALMAGEGLDMYHSLPLLSVYLGHQSLGATDGYVRLTAEMYPDLLKKSGTAIAGVFPVFKTQTDDEQDH